MTRRWMLLMLLTCLSLAPAKGQDPLQTLPGNYRKIFENAEVTVIRAHYGAHERIPVHDHAGFATVFIYLNDSSPVRIDHTEGGKTDSVVRPPTVAGAFRVIQGMAERHSIENLGDKPSDFLRIELKQARIDAENGFRGSAPTRLTSNMDSVEFSDPGVKVERIVCAGAGPCGVKPSDSPSLLVALSDLTIGGEHVAPGDVRWLKPAESLWVKAQIGNAPHLLRILLPQR